MKSNTVTVPHLGTKAEFRKIALAFVAFKAKQGINLGRTYVDGQMNFWEFKRRQYGI